MIYSKSCLVSRRVRAVIPLCGLRYGAHPPCAQPWLDSVLELHNTHRPQDTGGSSVIQYLATRTPSRGNRRRAEFPFAPAEIHPKIDPILDAFSDPKWIQNGSKMEPKFIKNPLKNPFDFFMFFYLIFYRFFMARILQKWALVYTRAHFSIFSLFVFLCFFIPKWIPKWIQNASKNL